MRVGQKPCPLVFSNIAHGEKDVEEIQKECQNKSSVLGYP